MMLRNVMVPVSPSGPCSDIRWMQGWPRLWKAQTVLSFLWWWMDQLGSGCLVGLGCGKGALFPFA